MLEGKVVEAMNIDNRNVKGRVMLVYEDAIASGTNMYVSVTYLMVTEKDGTTHTVRPRDVSTVTEEF